MNTSYLKTIRFWKWRYPLAAIAMALGLVSGALAFLPRAEGEDYLVAKREICAGCTLSPQDFELKTLPRGVGPDDAWRQVPEIGGATAAISIAPGTILSPRYVLGENWDQVAAGEMVLALELEDSGSIALARPGQRLEIWAYREGQSELLTDNVRVLTLQREEAGTLSLKNAATLVYLTTDEDSARRILAARADAELSFMVRK